MFVKTDGYAGCYHPVFLCASHKQRKDGPTMSEIVRGRSRGGYLVVDNTIIDGLLEQGSIDLAGFYSALKRFIDRRESSDKKAVMPWTVDMFCKKFGIGKRRFYVLATQLWQLGLLDVEKEIGDLDPQGSVKGWRNRYIVHDYPDYEGPLRVVREGSFVAGGGRGRTAQPAQPSSCPELHESEGAIANSTAEESPIKNLYGSVQGEGEEGIPESGEGYFQNGNTSEQMFGGISISEIPKTEIPPRHSYVSNVDLDLNNLEKTRSRKNNNNKKERNVVVVILPPSCSNSAGSSKAGDAGMGKELDLETTGPVDAENRRCDGLPGELLEEMRALDDGLLTEQIMEACAEAGEERVRRALSVVKQQKFVKNIPALFREALLKDWKPGRSARFDGAARQESCETAGDRASPEAQDREREKKKEFIKSLYV